MEGFATVRLDDGSVCDAEIRWFEAHGIGRRSLKIRQLVAMIGTTIHKPRIPSPFEGIARSTCTRRAKSSAS
jgi:hypothetical protein